MKKMILAAALVGCTGPVLAADLGSRPAGVPVMAAIPTWQGLYIGGHLGGVSNTDRWTFNSIGAGIWANAAGNQTSFNKSSFAGGAQIGYNWQFGQFVIGVDGSITAFDSSRSKISPFFPASDRLASESKWIALGQVRLGYAIGSWLIFGQGGVAFGDHRMNLNSTAIGFVNDSAKSTRTGWTIGAGVNYMLTPNWILGAEYNYVDFGRKTYTLTGNGLPADRISSRHRTHIGKVTVSYKF